MDKSMVEDVFTYHPPDEAQIESMKRLRKLAMELANAIFEECPACADRTAAIRKLREVTMTVNAGIVLKGLV